MNQKDDGAVKQSDAVLSDMKKLEAMRLTMSRREIKATPEFKRFIDSLCGKYAYLGQTVDDFLREKREEVERENRR